MGKRYDTPVEKSQHLPPPKPPRTPVPFLRGTMFHLQTKGLGEHPGTCSDIAYLLVRTGDTLEAQD